jgi:hypothetical protein
MFDSLVGAVEAFFPFARRRDYAVSQSDEKIHFQVVDRLQICPVLVYFDEQVVHAILYQFPIPGELQPLDD